MRGYTLLIAAVALFSIVGTAAGQVTITHPLDSNDPTTLTSGGVPDATRGWRFTVQTDNMYVLDLGVWAPQSSTAPVVCSLWDVATQTEIAQATTSPGADWCRVSLQSPVALTNGDDYIVTMHTGSGANYSAYYYGNATWGTNAHLTYHEARYANNTTNPVFPTSVLTGLHYGVPDIGYYIADYEILDSTGAVMDPTTVFSDQPGTVTSANPTVSYTLQNNTSSAITVSNIAISNEVNCTVTNAAVSGGMIPANGTATLTMDVAGSAPGAWSFEVDVQSSSANIPNYMFAVEGDLQPEIDVASNGTSLGDGTAATPIALGDVNSDRETSFQVTVSNSGNYDLTISTIDLTTNSGTFAVAPVTVWSEPSMVLPSSGSGNITVTYTPFDGAVDFTLTIASNDIDEPNYVISITQTVLPAPLMSFTFNDEPITPGATIDAGVFTAGSGGQVRIGAMNAGSGDMEITTYDISVGTGSFGVEPTFQLSTFGSSTIASGESDTMVGQFNPGSGDFAFTVTINSNDPDGPTSFTVTGTAVIPPSDCAYSPSADSNLTWPAIILAMLGLVGILRRLHS